MPQSSEWLYILSTHRPLPVVNVNFQTDRTLDTVRCSCPASAGYAASASTVSWSPPSAASGTLLCSTPAHRRGGSDDVHRGRLPEDRRSCPELGSLGRRRPDWHL